MTDFLKRYGQWGMVAGAAEGIGAAFCEELARKGLNLIMVDVNAIEMESLALRLETTFKIKTRSLLIDLAEEDSPEHCMEVVKETGCRLLFYNAAYCRVKPFLSANPSELVLYINVNTRTPLILVYSIANRLTYFLLTRILPRSMAAALVDRTMGQTYKDVIGH